MQTEKSKVVLDITSPKAAMAVRRSMGEYTPRVRLPGEALPQTISIPDLGRYDGKELMGSSRPGSMDAYAIPSRGSGG